MSAKARAKDTRPPVFFRLAPEDEASFEDVAGYLEKSRAATALHLVRWALAEVGEDPAKLFRKKR